MRKGNMANIVYAIGLIIMFVISVHYVLISLTGSYKDYAVVSLDNPVYLLRDSAEIAKSYIDNSARYSLVQSAYDNGMNGGFHSNNTNVLDFQGKKYGIWYNGSNIQIDDLKAGDELRKEFTSWFHNYTNGNIIKAIMPVQAPVYNEPVFRNDGYYYTGILMDANMPVTAYTKMDNGDEVSVSVPSEVNLSIPLPYFLMLKAGRDFREKVKHNISECENSALSESYETPQIVFSSSSHKSGDSCIVIVEIESNNEFLVWDGQKTDMLPLKLIFAMTDS